MSSLRPPTASNLEQVLADASPGMLNYTLTAVPGPQGAVAPQSTPQAPGCATGSLDLALILRLQGSGIQTSFYLSPSKLYPTPLKGSRDLVTVVINKVAISSNHSQNEGTYDLTYYISPLILQAPHPNAPHPRVAGRGFPEPPDVPGLQTQIPSPKTPEPVKPPNNKP